MIVANSKEELLEENKAYVLFKRQGVYFSVTEEYELISGDIELKRWHFAKELPKYECASKIERWSKSNNALLMAVRFDGSDWYNPAEFEYNNWNMKKYEVAKICSISEGGFIKVCENSIRKFTKGFLNGRN